MSVGALVVAYIIGGVTFVPLLLLVFLFVSPRHSDPEKPPQLKATEVEERNQTGLDAFKQGWLTVTLEYIEEPDSISSALPSVLESQEGKSAYSSLYKLVKNSNAKTDGVLPHEEVSEISQAKPGTSGSLALAGKKHRYFAVLKHGNLFLYKDEKLKDVKHVVVLSNHVVALWPRNLSEGSLFTKYSSIAILRKDWSRPRRLSDSITDSGYTEWSDDLKITIEDVLRDSLNLPPPPGSFFVYADINIEKEDWYFALVRATKADSNTSYADPLIHAKTLHFETADMVSLIQTLYSSDGQLHTKWFNAFFGRLFLSLQRTDAMKNYLVSRIEKKLNKMKTPGFLDKFQITKVDAGTSAPFLTFPTLKEINPEGDLVVAFHMLYNGGITVQLATKVTLNLGARFKAREMDVLLSMTLEKLLGPMLIKMKAPPSARMWYTFEREPTMSFKIEPVISSRQMSYNIITGSIEKKLKLAVRESLVLPHWDDMLFYDTTGELYRGGVWDKSARKMPEDEKPEKPEVFDDSETMLTAITFTEDEKLEASLSAAEISDIAPTKTQKQKLSLTLSDLSKKLRKGKSTHTLGVDETHFLSDGTMEHSASKASVNSDSASVSKHNEDVISLASQSPSTASTYHAPEMISNRRGPRTKSSATTETVGEETQKSFTYDFGSELKDSNLFPLASHLKPDMAVLDLLESSKPSLSSENHAHSLRRSDTTLRRKAPQGPEPDFPDDSV